MCVCPCRVRRVIRGSRRYRVSASRASGELGSASWALRARARGLDLLRRLLLQVATSLGAITARACAAKRLLHPPCRSLPTPERVHVTGMCCKLVKPFREDGQALRLNEKPNAGDITGSHSYTNYTSEVDECASLGTCGYVDDQPFNSSRVVGSQLYNVRLLTARFPPLLTPAQHRPVCSHFIFTHHSARHAAGDGGGREAGGQVAISRRPDDD